MVCSNFHSTRVCKLCLFLFAQFIVPYRARRNHYTQRLSPSRFLHHHRSLFPNARYVRILAIRRHTHDHFSLYRKRLVIRFKQPLSSSIESQRLKTLAFFDTELSLGSQSLVPIGIDFFSFIGETQPTNLKTFVMPYTGVPASMRFPYFYSAHVSSNHHSNSVRMVNSFGRLKISFFRNAG